jgi:hypothetical protein
MLDFVIIIQLFLLKVALLGELSQYFAMIKINLLEKSSMALE